MNAWKSSELSNQQSNRKIRRTSKDHFSCVSKMFLLPKLSPWWLSPRCTKSYWATVPVQVPVLCCIPYSGKSFFKTSSWHKYWNVMVKMWPTTMWLIFNCKARKTNKLKKVLISWTPKPKLAQRYPVMYSELVDCGDTGAISNPLKVGSWVRVTVSGIGTEAFY